MITLTNNLSAKWQYLSIALRQQALYMHVPANFEDKERAG